MQLSDEEKKSIELLKEDKRMLEENYTFGKQAKKQIANDIEKVLNLIEKQSKEIEELKNNHKGNISMNYQIINNQLKEIEWHKNVISKILKI